MPRIRTIKPEFWDSPDTAKASHTARLLYIAMWNWADDWGVGSANPKTLAGFAFPNDIALSAAELPSLMKEVADSFSVVFYEVGGRPYFAIPSWDDHQRTERKAKRLNPPPPDDVSAGQSVIPGLASELPTHNLGSSDEGTGEQGNRGKGTGGTTLPDKSGDAGVPALFEAFWDAYDHKVGRKKAEAAFRQAIKKADPYTLITAAGQYVAWVKSEGKHPQYTKHPTTWLNGEHWNDERAARQQPQTNTQKHMQLARRLATAADSTIGELE